MSMLVTGFTIAAAGIAGGAAGSYVGSRIKDNVGDSGPYLVRRIAGFVLGAVVAGGGTAITLSDQLFTSAQPSDIETCAAAAPKNSTVHFTRNEDGSSVCTYEMK